jgi:hypothetical protein
MNPAQVMADARQQADAAIRQAEPVSRVGAIQVISIWLISLTVFIWLIKAVFM